MSHQHKDIHGKSTSEGDCHDCQKVETLKFAIRAFLVFCCAAAGIYFLIASVFAASRFDLEREFNEANQQVFRHEQLAKSYKERAKQTRCKLVSIKLYAGEELRDPSRARIDCADTIPEDFWLGTHK